MSRSLSGLKGLIRSSAERQAKPICFPPSRIPFLRVSPCCDRHSQPTRGAFSFPIPQVAHLAGRVYRHILAVDRPDMRRIFIEVRSSDPKLFAVPDRNFVTG